ncbi:MAG: class I SAM-dependent methyltransferase [Candidatus Nanohaloarchaea archaeon]|nr:class I SAM-dependent methyltransferase [Candidatus Nanohaloarchaea archaeon]
MVDIADFPIGVSTVQDYYRRPENVAEYEEIRYETPGGAVIDERRNQWIREFFESYEESIDWSEEAPLDGRRVLVSAGGTGRTARYVADETGADTVCLGASRPMLQEAVRRDLDDAGIAYVQGDACRLPFGDEFDYAISLRSAHVLDGDITEYLSEMGRVADRGVLTNTFSAYSLHSLYAPFLAQDGKTFPDDTVETYIEEVDTVVENDRSNEFVVPYAGFYVAGNIDALTPIVSPLERANEALETGVADRIASVTVWNLESV